MELKLYLYFKKKEVSVMKKKNILLLSVMVVTLMWMSLPVAAAEYPTRAITIINPYPPGGTLDIQSRAFAAVAEKLLGQPVVVVNKAGATGMIGSVAGAQAAPDGYTLTTGSTANSCAIEWEIANGRKPPVTNGDFVTIGSFTMSPTLVVVPYTSPWKTVADLINDCKAKPDHYAFSSGGLYGMSHVPVEIFIRAAGVKCRHVPHKGGSPALQAVVGGHVDFANQFPSTSIPLYRGKKLGILAVQSDRRLKSIPEIPPVKELGLDAEFYAWVGILAPKGTPTDIIKKLRDVTVAVAKEKSFIDTIENTGDEVIFRNGDELAKFMDHESQMLAKLYKQLILTEKK